MDEIADHTSQRERRAVEAERDTDSLKKAQFMSDKIGEEFEGIVSSITNFGMFIELENTVEGLVHISNMTDDYYRFDDRQMLMVGERTARQFRIGDEVKIRVANVVIEESSVDFEIVGMISSGRPTRKAAPKVIHAGRSEAKRGERTGEKRDHKKRGGASSESSDRKRSSDSRGKRSESGSSSDRDPRGRRKDGKPKFFEGIAKGKKKKGKKKK